MARLRGGNMTFYLPALAWCCFGGHFSKCGSVVPSIAWRAISPRTRMGRICPGIVRHLEAFVR